MGMSEITSKTCYLVRNNYLKGIGESLNLKKIEGGFVKPP